MLKPFFWFLFLWPFLLSAQKVTVHPDSLVPAESRAKELLARMTPDEKFWQLYMIPGDLSSGSKKFSNGIFGLQVNATGENKDAAGQLLQYSNSGFAGEYAAKINSIQRFFKDSTRLGIPIIPFAEALHGLVADGATAFPQSIALAATWDTGLVHRVAAAIAEEARSRGIRQVLGPVINIARDVRWGRVEETYGEDPYLTTIMGDAYISAFENAGIVTTPKHFAVNSGDGGRDSYPADFNERILGEIYFPAFKSAIQHAGAGSVMSAYNSLNGSPCTANDWLLNVKLKKEWGFRGFVISDACAVGGANVLHYTAADYADATQKSIRSGLDVIFQTDYEHHVLFKEAFDKGMIPREVIDSAVVRVLRAKFQLGLFENPYADPQKAAETNGSETHRRLALQAARESVVLLKNENSLLPLKKGMKIAVTGPDAMEARLGGYSGPGIHKISILEGIRKASGNESQVTYCPGPGREEVSMVPVPAENFYHYAEGKKMTGLKGEYFDNIDLSGNPLITRRDAKIDFAWTLYPPDPALSNGWYSVRWSGKLKTDSVLPSEIGIIGNDGYRLYIDGKLIIGNWMKKSYGQKSTPFNFEKNKEYDVRVEFFEASGSARIQLVWNAGVKDVSKEKIDEAVHMARTVDAVIVVAGIKEGEFQDRAKLSLPGRQEELIRSVCATGKPVIVLLVGGSAITMSGWIDQAGAVLDCWYPGEAGGEAVGEIIFGDYNPAGRLPITFPVSEGQLPLVYNHKPTGRGDDYADQTGMPLFPFGYGLSYCDFEYSRVVLDKNIISSKDTVVVTFNLRNTGKFEGDEVCQLYLRDELASVARPVKELKAFQRVHLLAGEQKEVKMTITPAMLSMLDKDLKPLIEPGKFRIMIGSSSEDIRLRTAIEVKKD
ncbi:MAG: glycoside hydrolase family 3 N-terminal domain-containing protein [Syntrophothermus sp.]